MLTINQLKEKTYRTKVKCGEICIKKKKGHITSALSCAEIITVLYYTVLRIDPRNPQWKERDRFVMSKNHGSAITYPILQDLGFISEEVLDSYQDNGSVLGTHSKLDIPGVEFAGGSLGIGLGAACGMALAARADKANWLTFCLVGDCECQEGSIWEAIMFAGYNHLGNLVMIIDNNGEGCTDFTKQLIDLTPMKNKMEAFSWEVRKIKNGHNIEEIVEVFCDIHKRTSEKPLCIIADTVKGNGISSMEHIPWMHGQVPIGEKGIEAIRELKEGSFL
jgi:transketolase